MWPTPSDSAFSEGEIEAADEGASSIADDSGDLAWSASDVSNIARTTDSGNNLNRILLRIFLWILKQLASPGS
jgi:hypothetical protein